MATYLLLLILAIDPYLFGVNAPGEMMVLVLIVFFSTFLIPSFATFLMVQLGLAKTFTMEDRMDRTGPLIAAGIFYLWVFWNLYSRADIPRIYVAMMLGATIGLFVVFFFNIFFKISAHMAGMGGWVYTFHLSGYFFCLNWTSRGCQIIPQGASTKRINSWVHRRVCGDVFRLYDHRMMEFKKSNNNSTKQ